jgi:parvulin-like peptidyl-prolyl isomerase
MSGFLVNVRRLQVLSTKYFVLSLCALAKVISSCRQFAFVFLVWTSMVTYGFGQDILDAPPPDIAPQSAVATNANSLSAADAANLEGCQVIARVDDQIILACDVLWHVNMLLEQNKVQAAPDKLAGIRQQLMRREVAAMIDRKLLYNEFRRGVPAENLPRIEEQLQQPFEERKLPELMEQLHVKSQRDVQVELARLGSSLSDVQRSFNEGAIAGDWLRSKVKVNEDVSPDEMMEYYRAHLADYEYPSQARWEELMVRKNRFKDAGEAYAELARMGNDVWQQGTQKSVRGAAFATIAKAKSDGFTAKNGGVHEWTTKGALSCKELDDALFKLEIGQMSPIIDDGFAFHIVRVLERREAGRKPFTDVQANIRDKLKEKRFQVEAEKYIAKLRQDARIWTAFTGNTTAEALLRRPDESKQR